jgi:uncharacterized protein with HEPN domain
LPPREWRLRVEDILDAVAKIERYVEGLTFEQFQADQKTVDAVIRNLEVIGEAVQHLASHRDSLPRGVPWADIAGMRNILIHAYFGVDLKIVWHTIIEDLPMLRVQLQEVTPPDQG